METVVIAEISIKKKFLHLFTYEQIMGMALNTPKYIRLNDARKLIDIELRKNGFKPIKKIRVKAKKDKS